MKKALALSIALSMATLSAQAACPSWPTAERFTLNGEEATDTRTGLVWKRCSEGQTWSGGTCTGSASTFTHDAALARAKAQNSTDSATGWRLPNVKELFSLADKGCQSPAIDRTAFPDTPSHWYWSSSPYVGNSNIAWFVDFNPGSVSYGIRGSGGYHVRLVRASQ